MFDLVIRSGTVIDGTGRPGYRADVAVSDGRIVAVGEVPGAGRDEIDADGLIVTPGFIDIHTHYDGQVTWENRLMPSSLHGVTTAVIGNCGVGFAPCRPEHREPLIRVMEGVEDIPDAVMAQGIPWEWTSFTDYLDFLAQRSFDMDVAAYLPHTPLRVFVMGDRAIRREPATAQDMAAMRQLARQAAEAGAVGIATSRADLHRRKDGSHIPTFQAAEAELVQIALGIAEGGGRLLQVAADLGDVERSLSELGAVERVAAASGLACTVSVTQSHDDPEAWRSILKEIAAINGRGVEMTAQIFGRPMGMIFGFELSNHPFRYSPAFQPLLDLPFAERLAALRCPDLRERLIAEAPIDPPFPMIARMYRNFAGLYPMIDPPNYEPGSAESVAAIAQAAGTSALEAAYDLLLRDDGKGLFYAPFTNYAHGNLDAVHAMLLDPHCRVALADGGAHYGYICDASLPTFMLAYWARDRQAARLSVEHVVRLLTRDVAQTIGMSDRGEIAPGKKADLNIIDLNRLTLHVPEVRYDLPAGGARMTQRTEGYLATIVSGAVTYRNGLATGALPGALVRQQGVL